MLALASMALNAQTPNPIPNQIAGVGYSTPAYPAVALGSVVTIFSNNLNVPDAVASQTPLPTSLSGVSVAVRVVGAVQTEGYPAMLGILRVYTDNCSGDFQTYCPTTQITVQIPEHYVCVRPFMGACGNDLPPGLVINVVANGATGPDQPLAVPGRYLPHLLNTCDSILGPVNTPCRPAIAHGDGSLISAAHPAKAVETIVVYAVGLGFPELPVETLVFTYRIAPTDSSSSPISVPRFLEAAYNGSVSLCVVPLS